MRIRIGPGCRSWIPRAATTASSAWSKTTANSSPRQSISVPFVSSTALRTSRRCSSSAAGYASPSFCTSRVEPSISVKRRVTLIGSSLRPCLRRFEGRNREIRSTANRMGEAAALCHHSPHDLGADRRRSPKLPRQRARPARGGRAGGRGRGGGRSDRPPRGRAAPAAGRSPRRAAARHRRIRGGIASLGERRSAGDPRLEPRRLRLRPPGRAERGRGLHPEGRAVRRSDRRASRVTRIQRYWPLVAASALLLAGIAGATGAVSTHQSLALTVLGPLAGLAFVAAGLVGWSLRPDNGTGRLLVVIGFVFLIFTTLWASNDSVLYTTGNAFGSIYLAIFAQLLLTYPAGRLRTRRERVAIVALYCVAAAAALVPTFFRAKDTSCLNCPHNAFLIYDSKQTADVLNAIFSIVGIVVFASLFVVLALRWRQATPARRRVLAPVYICGGASVLFLGLGFGVSFASSTAGGVFWALALTCFIALPFCFVGGLLRWRVSRAGMRMLEDAGSSEAEASLHRALRDPSLRLA